MTGVPAELFQRWGHSFEEDTESLRVYRPADYDFPLARGRDEIEFHSGGDLIEWIVGPDDANQPVTCCWRVERPWAIRIEHADSSHPTRLLEIVELTPEILKVHDVTPP